ncbi:MAG: cation diffusion facilitator family transporter [Anaerolineales bacterium]|nr:cation diffusion facilitator family transporter [Anaerolineales bacterium]MDW8226348.1 cation diffusion facilitator family transporter [Anaerolineales bacterium]
MSHESAQKEKRSVALISVLAAVGLTAFKLIVGLLTNSLGILAEAAHSGLDLAAAAMTYFAVRVADKPADARHPFGHGKVENLSALFETLLLLATSGWIIYEAVDRLFFHPAQVEVSIWAFLVMGTSIAVDINRSKMLYRAAKKYNSQALEADALHFSTDIWSSSVVIFGLIGVTVARYVPGLDWMHAADSVAALVVAVIVIYVSGELGWRTISALVDAAPPGLAEKVERAASSVKDVVDAHAVRVRPSGARWFIDLHVTMDGNIHLSRAHAATELIEQAVQDVLPGADVTVHVEPAEKKVEKRQTTAETS